MKRHGSSDGDYKAQLWDYFTFKTPIDSSAVKISITATYSNGKVGIIDFELYSKGRFTQNCSFDGFAF